MYAGNGIKHDYNHQQLHELNSPRLEIEGIDDYQNDQK